MNKSASCFMCFHVLRIGDNKNLCGCLWDKTCEEDAEIIYEPREGYCPQWKSRIEEIQEWQLKYEGENDECEDCL